MAPGMRANPAWQVVQKGLKEWGLAPAPAALAEPAVAAELVAAVAAAPRLASPTLAPPRVRKAPSKSPSAQQEWVASAVTAGPAIKPPLVL